MSQKLLQYEKIVCDNIDYRKGVIEVSANIHPGFINLETTGVNPGVDLKAALDDDCGLEDKVSGSSELELSVEEATTLVEQLQAAISVLSKAA